MKYFTPERWLRLQDVSTREAFDAAHAGWQQALTEYRTELNRINDRLPRELHEFAHSESLHDGVLIGCWGSDEALLLLVRPEGDRDGVVQLEYDLVSPVVVRRGLLPPEWAGGEPGWMYDEVGLDGDTFTHDILLRDGSELRVRFSGFERRRVGSLLPEAIASATG